MKKLLLIISVLAIATIAFAQTAGETVANPMVFTSLPISYSDNTQNYGNDYDGNMITPTSSYLNGYDYVAQFTLPERMLLSGGLTTVSGSWIGLFIVNQEPSTATPAPVLASATSSGQSASFANIDLPAGTYYAIVSTWPTPDYIDFTLSISATAWVDPTLFYEDLPYPQSFDGVTAPALPFGWAKVGTAGSVYTQAYSANSTPNCVYIYGSGAMLRLPPVDMASSTDLRLRFKARAGYSTGDQLIVGYLTDPADAATFTAIQANTINSLTYTDYTVPLGSITGVKHFAIKAGTLSYSMYLDDLVLEEVPTTAVFELSPDVEDFDFEQVQINTTATQTFRVTNTGVADLTFSSVTVSGTGFSPDPAFNTDPIPAGQYRDFTVKFSPTEVQAYAGALTFNFTRDIRSVALTGTGVDYTIYAASLPYPQNFDGVTFPALPDGWLSLDNNADGDKWVTAASNPLSTPNAATIYTDYNSVNDDYLVTPRVELTGNQRLKFWTRAHSTGEPDEISILLSSTTPEAANFTLEAMATTAVNFTTYAEYTVDLSAYSGFHYIAFARKNAPADGWYLYIDDVLIENIPQTAVFQIDPDLTEPWPFGLVPVGGSAEKMFRITNIGGGTLTINSITSDNDPPFSVVEIPTVDHSLSANEYTDFKIVFTPQTTGGPYSATVTVDYGEAKTQYQIQFTGSAYQPATLPLTEGWESGQGNWSFVNGTQTNAWYIGTGDLTYGPYEGSNFAYISNDGGTTVAYTNTTTSVAHIYTDIAFGADNLEFPLSFYWRCQGEGTAWDRMRVYLVDTSVTPVAGTELTTGQVGLTNYNLQPAWTAESITLPGTLSGTVKRLVFSWKNDSSGGTNPPINLDNISLTATPNPTGPVLPPNLVYPVDRQDNLPIGGFAFQFSWNTGGTEPDAYNLYLANLADLPEGYTSDDFFAVATPYEDVTSPFDPAITYGYSETYVWTVGAYNATYPDEVYLWPPYEYTTEPDPTISIPHTQSFGTDATPVWPLNWTQSSTGSNVWTVTATANAGGIANEMTATWTSLVGTTRLITPPINTTGLSAFAASFNTLYDDYGTGITAKVQYSHDLATWYDTPWSIVSGSGDVDGYQTALIAGLVDQPTTYVAWVLDGDHFQYDSWYVDDVLLATPPDHDVGVVSWDYPVQVVVENTSVTPLATVGNFGLNTETFTVTCTIGAYSQTQTVTGLASFDTQQVSFPALTPALGTLEEVVITTTLATDTVAQNNTLYNALACVELHTPALANNAQTDQFVQFNLATPGILNPLPTGYTGSFFMSGGDWMNGNWMAVEYDDGTLVTDNYYEIDPLTGTYLPSLGEPGAAIMGIAYEDNGATGTLYGVGGADGTLYTLDPATGLATSVAVMWYNLEGVPTNLPDIGGLMIACAYDNLGEILYGIDLGNDCLWTINTTTAELTLVGFFGVDLNYAQDAAFDQFNGMLFLTGYSTFGGLYWVDTTYGGAYLVGPLGTAAYELDGFAIPYGEITAPEIAIAATGALSWPAVTGAVHYQVYKATDPYGTYAPYATVYGTTWTDPLFAEGKAFYYVKAVGGTRDGNREPVQSSDAMRKNGKLGQMRRVNTGLANQTK